MFQVLNCLAFEHDIRLVVLAAVLCILSNYVALNLLHRAISGEGAARAIWIATGGSIGGFGIWATHFVAMLAYDPGVVLGYDLTLTLLSLAIAIVSVAGAHALTACIGTRPSLVAAGVVFSLGVSTMHFMGMNALDFPGHIVWDQALVASAIVVAVSIATPAFFFIRKTRCRVKATAIACIGLTLAIVGMHFTAMGAVLIVPDSLSVDESHLLSPFVMVVTITTVTLCMLFSGFAAAFFAMRAETITAAGERKLSYFIKSVSDHAIYMLDCDGMVSNWNNGAERAKGYAAADIVGKSFGCFYLQEEQDAGLPALNLATARDSGKFSGEGWRVRKDGTKFWAQVVIEAVYDDGELIGFAKVTRDCTEAKLAALKLEKASADLQLALDHMNNALCLFDEKGRLAMYNRRLSEILGCDPDLDLTGRTAEEICSLNPTNASDRLNRYMELRANGGGEVTAQLDNGKYVRTTYLPTNQKAWVFTLEDVTARVLSEERISHMARHDVLTGLPNRRQFIELLDAKLAEADVLGTRVAVINIDLDRFKDINDTYGHATGDQVLCALSERMRKDERPGEMIGRFGGDEFVAMKAYRDHDDLKDLIIRLRKALTETIKLDMTDVTPGASMGVAIYPLDATDREKLMSNADMAMYRAKEDFDETVCFYEASMDEAERERRQLALDIWVGWKEEQFFLNYQVQRTAGSHAVSGYEVLLRWKHPTLGLVPPNVFIPIAEECGAIAALGEWVLEKACQDAAAWPLNERIAVNLSPLQLSNVQLVEKVRNILISTELSPERLELEVTESAIIGDKQRALHILRQIRAMGVTIAIDDFGTGYSSLETLRSFPFDKIKLDRSFVADLETDKQSRAFVRAILALGKSLEIPVLAEGIETETQMRMLTMEGCNLFQGYYFGRPGILADTVALQLAPAIA
nr:EAL domain-containing protein [Brucella anthropi]